MAVHFHPTLILLVLLLFIPADAVPTHLRNWFKMGNLKKNSTVRPGLGPVDLEYQQMLSISKALIPLMHRLSPLENLTHPPDLDNAVRVGRALVPRHRVTRVCDVDSNGVADYIVANPAAANHSGSIRLYLMGNASSGSFLYTRDLIPGNWGFRAPPLAPGDRFGAVVYKLPNSTIGSVSCFVAVAAPGDGRAGADRTGALYLLKLSRRGNVLKSTKVAFVPPRTPTHQYKSARRNSSRRLGNATKRQNPRPTRNLVRSPSPIPTQRSIPNPIKKPQLIARDMESNEDPEIDQNGMPRLPQRPPARHLEKRTPRTRRPKTTPDADSIEKILREEDNALHLIPSSRQEKPSMQEKGVLSDVTSIVFQAADGDLLASLSVDASRDADLLHYLEDRYIARPSLRRSALSFAHFPVRLAVHGVGDPCFFNETHCACGPPSPDGGDCLALASVNAVTGELQCKRTVCYAGQTVCRCGGQRLCRRTQVVTELFVPNGRDTEDRHGVVQCLRQSHTQWEALPVKGKVPKAKEDVGSLEVFNRTHCHCSRRELRGASALQCLRFLRASQGIGMFCAVRECFVGEEEFTCNALGAWFCQREAVRKSKWVFDGMVPGEVGVAFCHHMTETIDRAMPLFALQ